MRSKICNITLIYYGNSSVVVDLLWGRYHVPQDVFLVFANIQFCSYVIIDYVTVKYIGHYEKAV